MKLTPWFAASIKPVHIGVYKTRCIGAITATGYSYWDGKRWSYQAKHVKSGVLSMPNGYQGKGWCGLINPPKGAK